MVITIAADRALDKRSAVLQFDPMDIESLSASGVKTQINEISPSFCLAKWYQVTLNLENGSTRSCHHVKAHKFNSLAVAAHPPALHNTDQKKLAREQMLTGSRPKECSYCWKIEDSGGISDRFYKSSEDWASKNLQRAVESGSKKDILPTYLEVSFDSVCNFKCAYCGPAFSTSWEAEIQKYGAYPTSRRFNHPLIRKLAGNQTSSPSERKANVDAFWQWWPELGPSLEHLRVTGGEPLLSKETWRLLDHLIEEPKPQLHFSINSNLSADPTTLDRLIAKINALEGKVSSFTLFTSVDSVGTQAEYIRYGLNFDRLMSNVESILTRVKWKITVSYMISVNALSLPGLRPLLQLIMRQRRQFAFHHLGFDVPYLHNPEHMSVQILPREWMHYLESTIAYMENTPREHPSLYFFDSEIHRVQRILGMMKNSKMSRVRKFVLRRDFAKMFIEYDRRRRLNFAETFPEHSEFWKNCLRLARI